MPRHLGGEPTNQAVVHLFLMNQPSDTFVNGIPISDTHDASPPDWNLVSEGDLIHWYTSLFAFADLYLDDDGGPIVMMPFELSYELHRLAQKVGLEVKAEWICTQLEPLVHPQFPNMMVCSLESFRSIIFFFNFSHLIADHL